MRVTRAALRAQAQDDTNSIHEDADQQQDEPFQQTPDLARPPLKDITDDNFPTSEPTSDTDDAVPTKKAAGKKMGKSQKPQDVSQSPTEEEQPLEQCDDTTNSADSVQVEQSVLNCVTQSSVLSPGAATNNVAQTNSELESCQTPIRNVTVVSKTPKFDPEIHAPLNRSPDLEDSSKEDSFVESIKTRSPTKISKDIDIDTEAQDSFIDHIRTRTPAKMSPRIEDSVDAIDALEDAIEEISGELPSLGTIALDSPLKMHRATPAKPLPPSARKTALDTTVATKTPKVQARSPLKSKTSALRGAPPRTSSGRLSTIKPTTKAPIIKKAPGKVTNVLPKTSPPTTTRPVQPSTKSEDKQQSNVVKKRVLSGSLSTSKPAFVPAKSTKPVTKSTFSLPGEVISTKLKAQREERAKREEQEAEKKKIFKSRPAPPRDARPSIAPRQNRTASARLSLATNGSSSDKENAAPAPKPIIAKAPTAASGTKGRLEVNKANSSVRRATSGTVQASRPSIAPRASMAPRVASLTIGQKSAVTKEDALKQKVHGKEVFSRNKADLERLNQDRKEKEEAAKKARAEAAEKGRLASREWAEKQKKKVAAVAAIKAQQGSSATATVVPAAS